MPWGGKELVEATRVECVYKGGKGKSKTFFCLTL
jgi:hypothetical protein